MSILMEQRKKSRMQFLDSAVELKSFTRQQCLKLPKRFTFFGGQETYQSAARILEHVKKANSIYPLNSREEFQMRRNHFVAAYAELNYLLECVGEIRELFPVKDTIMVKWIGMIDEEMRLVKSIITKDKERFKEN